MTYRDLVFPVAATLAQLLPPLAVMPGWARATPARRWIAAWCLLFFVSDIAQFLIGQAVGNNQWFFIFVEPIEDAFLLWALSHWQVKPVARLAFRAAIPLIIATWVTIAFVTGEHATFKTFSGPFRALLMMGATVFTLISNVSSAPERAWNRDWLWTAMGVLLYFGLLVATEPIVAAMGPDQISDMLRVYTVRSIGDVLAFILIWRGMRCPLPSSSSGSI